MKFTIPLAPITKKNHNQMILCKGRPMMLPSKPYLKYEKDCKTFMPNVTAPIDRPVNVKAHYFMPTRRLVDLTNLESALLDILVRHGVLKDDNCKIVVSTDGSRVFWDPDYPRTEVTISEASF